MMKKLLGLFFIALLSVLLLAQPVYALDPVTLGAANAYTNGQIATLNANGTTANNNATPISVLNYNASGSALTTTGTINASSHSLSLAAALDFKNGQGITIANAGAACLLSAPTGLTVTPTGTAGTTHYTYAVAAIDVNGGVSAVFSASTTTGNATLSTTNYNAFAITCSGYPQAYAVWRTATTGSAPLGFIGYFDAHTAYTGGFLQDTGLPVVTPPLGIPTSAPGTSLAGILVTTITSGAGTTTLTLANAATTAVTSGIVRHNDVAAIQAAATAAGNTAGGAIVYIPPGTYFGSSITSQVVTVPANVTITGADQNLTILTDIPFVISAANVTIENLSETNCATTEEVFYIQNGAGNLIFRNVTVSNSVT